MIYTRHTWLPERFCWAVIETDLPAEHLQTRQARYQLEELLSAQLPLPIESVHAIYRTMGDRKVLACALPKETLGTVPLEWIELRPSALPEFLSHTAIDPELLNLLTGEFEPRVFQKSARLRTLVACAAMFFATALICTGWIWRSQAAGQLAQSAEHEVAEAANRTLNAQFTSSDEALASTHEVVDRARILATSGKDIATFDAARALESVLAKWPHNDEVAVQNLSVTQDAVSINLDIRGDAQAFLKSLAAPQGWKLDEPRLSSANGSTRVSIVMHPPQEGGGK